MRYFSDSTHIDVTGVHHLQHECPPPPIAPVSTDAQFSYCGFDELFPPKGAQHRCLGGSALDYQGYRAGSTYLFRGIQWFKSLKIPSSHVTSSRGRVFDCVASREVATCIYYVCFARYAFSIRCPFL